MTHQVIPHLFSICARLLAADTGKEVVHMVGTHMTGQKIFTLEWQFAGSARIPPHQVLLQHVIPHSFLGSKGCITK